METKLSLAPLEVEVLKDLREGTRVFVKLDFAYLAAAGAIITALKIGQNEIMEISSNWSAIGYAFILLCCVDTFIHSLIFNDWLIASTGTGKRKSPKLISVLLELQPFCHLMFVAFLIVGGLAYSSGRQRALTEIQGKVLLQDEVELYMRQTGSPPTSLNDLKLKTKRVQTALNMLDGQDVKFEATGPKSYKITYAGRDKMFGTADDEITTQDQKLRPIWEHMQSDLKASDAKK